LLLAQHRFYGEPWIKTGLKFVASQTSYLAVIIVATLLTLLAPLLMTVSQISDLTPRCKGMVSSGKFCPSSCADTKQETPDRIPNANRSNVEVTQFLRDGLAQTLPDLTVEQCLKDLHDCKGFLKRLERVYVIRLAREAHQTAKLPSSARREFSQTKVTPPTYYQSPSDKTVIDLNYQQAGR
jgi:hypothetical protein